MTKVNKIGSDLLEFFHEDTKIAEKYKGYLAIAKFNELQSKAVDTKVQDRKSHDYTLGLFWDLMLNKVLDDDDFIEFVNKTKPTSLQILTGRTVFNENKYNKKIKDRENQMKELIDKYNSVISNTDLDLQTQERTALEIMKEFDALNRIVINKSEKEFHEPEFETLEISAEKALEIVKLVKDNYDLKCNTDIENKRVIEIEKDRERFKDISEDDFQLIKQLQRLIDSTLFFNMFEYNPVYKYDAIHYDSLEDYFNRDRDIKSDVKLELTNQEMSAVRYIYEIFKSYNTQCRSNKLKQDLSMMKQSLKGDHND